MSELTVANQFRVESGNHHEIPEFDVFALGENYTEPRMAEVVDKPWCRFPFSYNAGWDGARRLV